MDVYLFQTQELNQAIEITDEFEEQFWSGVALAIFIENWRQRISSGRHREDISGGL